MFHYSEKNPSMPVVYSSINVMHTQMEIIIAGITGEKRNRYLISHLWDVVKNDDRKLNRFISESDTYKINSEAINSEAKVDDEMFMILKMCQIFQSTTNGYFDVSANIISRNCHEEHGNRYTLNDNNHTVKFQCPDIALDFGGFAKGFTLEKIVKIALENEVKFALFNAGDSSTYGLGTHPFGEYWPVGIRHPFFPAKNMYEFHLKDGSLSVSGKNRQGKSHITDPKTGNIVKNDEMIAVNGPSPLITEILSTALYAAPKEVRGDILKNYPGYNAISILPLCNGDRIVTSII